MNPTELPDHWETLRKEIASRIRELRIELYGEHGGPILAAQLDLPSRLWIQYEWGSPMPSDVMLRFLAVTRAEPHWLLTGAGEKFRQHP